MISPAEKYQLIADRDDWKARTEKAERERDEAKRDLQKTTDSLAGRIIRCASSQAREQELRAALVAASAEALHDSYCELTCAALAGRVAGPCTCPLKSIDAALARPSDTSALREFGLKVAHDLMLANGWNMNDAETIVDAVLGAPTALK